MNVQERLAIITGENILEEHKEEFSLFTIPQFDWLDNRLIPKEYETMYLGNFVKPKCAVQTQNGEHCPDEVAHTVIHNDKEIGLCDRCYLNYQEGAFKSEAFRRNFRYDYNR